MMSKLEIILPLLVGGGLGLMLRWTRLSTPDGLKNALALRRSHPARSLWTALGWAVLLTALMSWLAVIDVDTVRVFPQHGGVLIAGAIFGVAAGLSGFTPLTACAGVGSFLPGRWGRPVEAVSVLAGVAAAVFLPLGKLPELFASLPPQANATLFRVTLDKPWLLDGGFRGQMLLGLLLLIVGACILPPRRVNEPEAPAPAADPPPPEEASAETFVAVLPGEEALVVDTEMPGEDISGEADSYPEEENGESAPADMEEREPPEPPMPLLVDEFSADPDVLPGGDATASIAVLQEDLLSEDRTEP